MMSNSWSVKKEQSYRYNRGKILLYNNKSMLSRIEVARKQFSYTGASQWLEDADIDHGVRLLYSLCTNKMEC